MKNLRTYRLFLMIFFIIAVILSVASYFIGSISAFREYIFLVDGIIIVLFYTFNLRNKTIKKLDYLERKMELWNNISYRVKKAGEYSFSNLPLAIIVYNNNYEIEWANSYAKDVFLSPLVDRNIRNINEELKQLIDKNDEFDITIYGKIYSCQVLKEYNVLYLTDKTDYANLQKRYHDRTLAIGFLNIDNLDQALSTKDAQEKSLQMSNIIGILSEWSDRHQIYLKGVSEEKYLLVLDYSQLQSIITENFKILDDIKTYCAKEGIRISVSVGVSCEDNPTLKLVEIAEGQLEMALERGGDQACVNIDGNVKYYGARQASYEQRSATYVRGKTEEFIELVKKSSNVIIMGHNDSDSDSLASCIAISKICQKLGKDAKIVFDYNRVDKTIQYVYDTIKRQYTSLIEDYISPSKAVKMIKQDTLVIISDCQYTNLLMDLNVYKKAKHLAIIDHHRRNTYAINNYDFLYTHPSSSSATELIIEMFEFVLDGKFELSEIEATLMLMAIIVDTNNLMYRTTDRTFNVLSKLNKLNADMGKARRFLREDFDEYLKKISLINKLEDVLDGYGIVVCDDEEVYERQFLAKIADNIIALNKVKAAFCIGKIGNNQVGISARSLDEVNVQIIMEQLKGGGHFNNAACQLDDCTLQEARDLLVEKIKVVKEGESNAMKIILIKDVKGKGKKDDIIEVPGGYGNYLVKSNQAVEASVDNVKQLESNQEKAKIDAENHLEAMRELKTKLDSLTVTVKVKVGKEGKIFGAVSSKQIIEAFKSQNGIEIEKRKLMYERKIEALGTYKIPVALHKEVRGIITLYVVEDK